ncbi:MAG: hypothetical protein Q7R33_05010 [Nitrosarchaeum sp.]|nr:hypothetical protein [Nitrosarchaeum sp.]
MSKKENIFCLYLANYVADNTQSTLRYIVFLYRLALSVGISHEKIKAAAQVLCEDFKSAHLVAILLACYIRENSNLMLSGDVQLLLGDDASKISDFVQTITTIANSGAKITIAKQKQYQTFPKEAMIIKASLILTDIRYIDFKKSAFLPKKLYERYIPIFDAYPQVGNFVMSKLKRSLLRNVKNVSETDGVMAKNVIEYLQIIRAPNFAKDRQL